MIFYFQIKMGAIQIVFLFDLNAFDKVRSKPTEILAKGLQCVRLACLRILTEFSNKTSNLRWGFKFFDSCGSVTQKMCKFSFSDLSLEAFETLESEVCSRYERHVSYAQALSESIQNNISPFINVNVDTNAEKHIMAPIKILQLALSQILSEFQWEHIDMWSPSTNKLTNSSLGLKRRNFLVLFSDVSNHDDRVLKYFGLESIPSKTKLTTTILPQTLREQLLVKANIHWIWVNVSQDQIFLGNVSSIMLPLLSEALHLFQGSLIPLSILSQSLYYVKASSDSIFKDSVLSNSQIGINNSLLPFSAILYHSIHESFYSNASSTTKIISSLVYNDIQIPVQLIKILNSEEKEFNLENTEENEKNTRSIKKDAFGISVMWSKMVIQGALSRTTKHIAEDILLCLPTGDESNISELENFTAITRTLSHKEINLVVVCMSENGIQMPALLTPLSEEAAFISILDPLVHFMNKPKIEIFSAECFEKRAINVANAVASIKNLKPVKDYSDDIHTTDSSLKQYQMESLEMWFKPKTSVSSLASYIKSKRSNSNKITTFHKLLQHSIRNRNNLQATSSKEEVLQPSVAEIKAVKETIENEEVLADLNLEQLVTASKDIYDSCLESSASVLDSAKKIVRLVSNYYKKHGGSSFEENVQNFMKDNLFMTVRRISEKYEMSQSEEDTNKKIKECQIQILLLLEIEGLTLPPDKSVCVNSVTALLRMMSFYSGALQLNKLLYETLRENYSNKLYDVLVDIGDELDMPIFEEADSSDSPDVSSELMDGELFGSTISSNMSTQSSSSMCSRKSNNRKLVRHRSDISDTIRSRQVLLPGTSPKKKKGKFSAQGKSSAQKKSTRCSPRIAAKKNERQTRSKEEKSGNVRRNLFPKEKACQTPKKHKGAHPTTPRSKKRITPKNKFVADTPSYKQNHSALQRRKSSIELDDAQKFPKEITESPNISKTAKSDCNKELLNKLRQRLSDASLKTAKESSLKSEASSLSFRRYTPESKKRLSLKLFSKLLTSPTARMGIKRCTKRLFDQVSPQKKCESFKKHKPLDESKLAVSPMKESNSLNIQEAVNSKFVAETPSKQNESEVWLTKSSIEKETLENSLEQRESKRFLKNDTDEYGKENLMLLRRKSEGNVETSKESSLKEGTSFSLPPYTPDSKKRLSLKLFSKFPASPTARTGIRKCTKRLFDQASPEKNSENNKICWSYENSNFASTSKKESNS